MEIWLNTLTENINNPDSERYNWIKKNIDLYPEIKIVPSVNGKDKKEVANALKKTGLDFYQTGFRTYGTLAVFLSKFLAWQKQLEEKIPYLCLIEDDLELTKEFLPFLESKKNLLENPGTNVLRLGDWGEAYFTSLESAKRLVAKIKEDGIRRNIDEQMWASGEVVVNESLVKPPREDEWVNGVWRHKGYKHDIFRLLKKTNAGVPLQTDMVPKTFSKSYYAGGPFDIRGYEIENILKNSSGNKYLTFALGSTVILMLEKLNQNSSLTAWEWGGSYTSLIEYKHDFKIQEERLIVKDMGKSDPELIKDFAKKWGNYGEEVPNSFLADLININYKDYDVYILDGFSRALTAFFALHNNPNAEVFIHDAVERNWYDWVKSIFKAEQIGPNTVKVALKD